MLGWQGEVALVNSECVPMGNARYGSDPGSAYFTSMFYEKQGAPGLLTASAHDPESDFPQAWDAGLTEGDPAAVTGFHFGGPGYC